jgi:hypothetical protein
LPDHDRPRGAYEDHWLQAWPECQDIPGCELVRCEEEEHGDKCGVKITPIDAPIRRWLIMDCAWMGNPD